MGKMGKMLREGGGGLKAEPLVLDPVARPSQAIAPSLMVLEFFIIFRRIDTALANLGQPRLPLSHSLFK